MRTNAISFGSAEAGDPALLPDPHETAERDNVVASMAVNAVPRTRDARPIKARIDLKMTQGRVITTPCSNRCRQKLPRSPHHVPHGAGREDGKL
jgi:hypothetical protein